MSDQSHARTVGRQMEPNDHSRHDLWQQTVQIAVGYILPDALAFQPKLTIEPIIQCIHQPMSNAYIETNDNSSNPPLISG